METNEIKYKKLFEDFIDDIEDEIQRNEEPSDEKLGIDPTLRLPKGDEPFTFVLKTKYCGINYHWAGHDPHFYPLKTIYKRIYKVLDRTAFLKNPTLSMPFMTDANYENWGKNNMKNKMEQRQIELSEFSDESLDVNSIYGYNEISNDTEFIYNINFCGIPKCSFRRFIHKMDEILQGIYRAIHIFNNDNGEITEFKDNRQPDKRIWHNPLYLQCSTKPQESYAKIFKVLRPEAELTEDEMDSHSHDTLLRQRTNIDIEAVVAYGTKDAMVNADPHPVIKIHDAFNVPLYSPEHWQFDGRNPLLSFIVADLTYPGLKEVDLTHIDWMVARYLALKFPMKYFSCAVPTFIFRVPIKVTENDKKESYDSKKHGRRSSYTESDGEFAVYRGTGNEVKTVFKAPDEFNHEIVIEPAECYHSGRDKRIGDWRIRVGTCGYAKWITVICNKDGYVGNANNRIGYYSNAFPFEDWMSKQLSKFMDNHKIFDGDYGL